MHQRLPLISLESLSSSKCLDESVVCRLYSSVISGKNVLSLHSFLLTNAVLLFFRFCSYEIFSHVHNTFALSFFNSKGVKYDSVSKVASNNPSHKTLV